MPLLRDIEGKRVTGSTGAPLGTVLHVLFHPSAPRVVGLEVRPVPRLLVVPRRPRCVPLACVAAWEADSVVLGARRLPSARAGEGAIGHPWESTVVWAGMPAGTRSGEAAGAIADAGFTKRTGSLTRLLLSAGALADAALGTREIPGELVDGFDGEKVVVADEALGGETSGGAVRVAGEAAGVARRTTRSAVVKTAAAGMAAVHMAGSSKAGRAVRRATGRAIEGVRRTMAEALAPEDEE